PYALSKAVAKKLTCPCASNQSFFSNATSPIPNSLLKVKLPFDFKPFFKVTNITPFAPRDPYNEVATASFNTVTDSIVEGSMFANGLEVEAIPDRSLVVTGTLLTTTNGMEFPVKVVRPRTNIGEAEPGCPLAAPMLKPATCPCNA